MREVLIYGAGSTLIGDLEEGLARAGIAPAAIVRNHPGPVHALAADLVVGADELTDEQRAVPFLAPLFTPANRRAAADEAEAAGLRPAPAFVDPSVARPRSATFGEGVWVNAGCALGASLDLARFALVNRGAGIGHHAVLRPFASIGPGAVLAGHVEVGEGAVVAAGATVLPEVRIGARAVVGAGAVVTRDVPEDALVLGNPARRVAR